MNETDSARPSAPLALRAARWMLGWQYAWRRHTATINQAEVIGRIRDDANWTARFAFMTLMSAGIAILGLLQNSAAVIIGAMLIAPLMGPILALGFAIATADGGWMRQSALTLIGGIILALLLCMIIVKVSPIETVTTEILGRTRPTLFDLGVALFSAMAGSYAIIHGRAGTIIGVAIATALMPPLAVVGFGFATQRWDVFGGALLLFFTNFMTIALTAAVVARLYGFSSRLSPDQTRLQTIGIIVAFFVLAIPLGYSLREIAWAATAQRQAREAIQDAFDPSTRISDLNVAKGEPVVVTATILTTVDRPDARQMIHDRLARAWDLPVDIRLIQYRVDTPDDIAAREAELAESSSADRGNSAREAISHDLALIAGVPADSVLVDGTEQRATVRTQPLPGATLATYHALERRLAAMDSGWTIELVPPLLALPAIALDDGKPTEGGAAAMATISWAAQRTGVPVAVGVAEDSPVITQLRNAGIIARPDPSLGSSSEAGVRWDARAEAPDVVAPASAPAQVEP